MTLAESIKHEAKILGFDTAGISRVLPCYDSADSGSTRLMQWLRQGYHGTMAWLARDPTRRSDPRLVLPGCRSVISVGLNYYTDRQADEAPDNGRIARYAWGEDYHDVFGKRLDQLAARIRDLAPEAETRWYVDTGPVMEKAWAQQAGLGWIGKHSNLVSTRFGSWLLLGEILTTLELDARRAGRRSVRIVHALHSSMPNGGHRGTVRRGRAPLYFLPHDRIAPYRRSGSG